MVLRMFFLQKATEGVGVDNKEGLMPRNPSRSTLGRLLASLFRGGFSWY
jgi:hypothetical protein